MPNILKGKYVLVLIIILSVALLIGGYGLYLLINATYLKENGFLTDTTSQDLIASSAIVDKSQLVVEITGAVKKPGVYTISNGSRIADLILMAQGYTDNVFAEWISRNLNTTQVLQDSEKIYIPFVWDTKTPPMELKDTVDIVYEYKPPLETTQDLGTTSAVEDNSSSATTQDPINVNTGSRDQLNALKGIGEVYLSRIIANRPYKNLDELISKAKIPSATVKNIEAYIKFQ